MLDDGYSASRTICEIKLIAKRKSLADLVLSKKHETTPRAAASQIFMSAVLEREKTTVYELRIAALVAISFINVFLCC